ncbi:RimK family alpha-L-glutamate ligase [Arthrobacter sp. GCM10027362]|uniref:ATP-grasp domain-containing protein n=1 Tax=Arthrobacter sp. GCM10027362 TaxID=3273379 RepID=UPI00363438FC
MKVAFLMRRPADDGRSITTEVVRLLRDWRATVDLIHVDTSPGRLADLHPEHDLYVLRTVTDASLSLAGILERQGARCVNPVSVSQTCRDKALVAALLGGAGVPVPESWLVERPHQLAPLLAGGPMVLKPLHGSQGRGVRVVWDPDELLDVGAEVPLVAQRYQPHQGRDRKLYCIGGQLFGVKRQWPATTYEQKQGEPFTVTAELHEIALTVGQVIGTDLFGLDIVISRNQPYVVDVNPFPGFKGVPDAALRLADYIYATAAEDVGPAVARKVIS